MRCCRQYDFINLVKTVTDYIIDIGPDGDGEAGGRVVAAVTPLKKSRQRKQSATPGSIWKSFYRGIMVVASRILDHDAGKSVTIL